MIAADHLTTILRSSLATDWYKKRIILATGMVAQQRIGHAAEPEEVVGETIVRVLTKHSPRYLWDGKTPETFNRFFTRCMNTTTAFFKAKGRSQIRGLEKFKAQVVFPTSFEVHQDLTREADCKNRSLATAIIKDTRLRGAAALKYIDNLPHYVANTATVQEIAVDLNVKPGTVSTIRSRLLMRFGDDVEKG